MSWQENRKKEIEKLFACIEKNLNVTKEQLISKSRKKEFVSARVIFMNIVFECFKSDNMIQDDIADLINRNRCTFIHHRSGHLDFYKNYKAYKEEYDKIKKEYTESLK